MDTAYFDNAATTFPKPESVYRFMDEFYRSNGVNVGRGQYSLSSNAANVSDATRTMLLDLFHCQSKKVVFTPTNTEAMNIILQGLELRENANVYITPFEHNAVTRILTYLQSIKPLSVHQLYVDKRTISYDLNAIETQFRDNHPDLVIMIHASNTCGVIAPISQICKLAKAYHAVTVIDMAQSAGLIDTDLSSEDFDFAVFAGHKTLYGPFGISGFITSDRVKIKPLLYGGTGFDSANQELPLTTPQRFEVGSTNINAIAGLYAALKWIKVSGIDQIYKQEQKNRATLVGILSNYTNVKVILPKDPCIGVVSCVFDGYGSDSIGNVLGQQGVSVRTGLHCAPYAHRFLGTFPAGTVRLSVSYFTSEVDFDILNNALTFIEENS